jgi:hypothetical protein
MANVAWDPTKMLPIFWQNLIAQQRLAGLPKQTALSSPVMMTWIDGQSYDVTAFYLLYNV